MPPGTRPPADTSSLRPATPVILICLELKIACPRAIDARGSWGGKSAHALKGLKIAGENWPSPGVNRPPGGSSAGTRGWILELMLTKNGRVWSGDGPPFATVFRGPAEFDVTCAVVSAIWRAAIWSRSAAVGLEPSPCACTTVAVSA